MRVSPQIRIVIRVVLLEFIRRKDLWILAMLMGVFALVAIAARVIGVEDAAAANFMLNLGLGLAGAFAHLLTVIMAGRQIPDEIENRTLYPLLAKPLSRSGLILGKWLACAFGGSCIFLVFSCIALAVSPFMQAYVTGTFLQHILLQPFALGLTASIAIAFSLLLPRGFATAASILLVFGAETIHQWANGKTALVHFLPRVGALNLSTRYTDGIQALPPVEWGSALIYAILWCAFCLLLASRQFERRAL